MPAAQTFVELLGKQDFAAAERRFSDELKAALPEDKLRETWRAIEADSGPFRAVVSTRRETQAGYEIAFVTTQFEKKSLDLKVVFDREGRVSGFWILPAATASAGSAPPYARPEAFRESELSLGEAPWTLPATLSLPLSNRPCPAVVLIHGSGPNDRDETVGANKPFRDLAWGLASRGIAVLRYEKRTKTHPVQFVGLKGRFTVKEEVLDDALAAAALLRRTDGIDARRVYVLGHSLGGMLAPRIGALDTNLAGLIILAGATRQLEDLMVEQTTYLVSLQGAPSPEGAKQLAELKKQVAAVKALRPGAAAGSGFILGAPPQYWLDLRAYDPVKTAQSLGCPMLVLQGGRDYQVTSADYAGWQLGLSARANVTLRLFESLNHLFIGGEGKSTPAEYDQPGHVAEEVIETIAIWIGSGA